MGRKTGVTGATTGRHFLDAGVVYLNWGSKDPDKPQMVLGATRGGSTFNVNTEWRDMPYDGVSGIVRGARRAVGNECTLTVNLTEIHCDILKYAVPGSTYTELTTTPDGDTLPLNLETYDEIKRIMEKTLPDFEYTDVAIVAEYSGTKLPVICGIKNAMVNSNLELSFADKDESVLALTFTGTLDPDRPDVEPWFMIIPKRLPEA